MKTYVLHVKETALKSVQGVFSSDEKILSILRKLKSSCHFGMLYWCCKSRIVCSSANIPLPEGSLFGIITEIYLDLCMMYLYCVTKKLALHWYCCVHSKGPDSTVLARLCAWVGCVVHRSAGWPLK